MPRVCAAATKLCASTTRTKATISLKLFNRVVPRQSPIVIPAKAGTRFVIPIHRATHSRTSIDDNSAPVFSSAEPFTQAGCRLNVTPQFGKPSWASGVSMLLVTGATGNVGKAVIADLTARNIPVPIAVPTRMSRGPVSHPIKYPLPYDAASVAACFPFGSEYVIGLSFAYE